MQDKIDKFYSYLDSLERNYEKLFVLIKEKLDAVDKNDIGRLDDIIKEEQVYVLLAKGFDQNISNYRKQLGLCGEKLSDIIDELPEEVKPKFNTLASKLRTLLDEIRITNEKCQSILEAKLHVIGKKLKDYTSGASGSYGNSGQPQEKKGYLSKSI